MMIRLQLCWLIGLGLTMASGEAAPIPRARLDGVPAEVLIGGTFSFRVGFKNVGNQPGFVPYFDLVVDSGGADMFNVDACLGGSTPCDGLTILPPVTSPDARDILYNQPPFNAGFYNYVATPCTALSPYAPHPLAHGGLPPIFVCVGQSWAVFKLENGVIQPNEPEVFVDVQVKVSDHADLGTPLRIQVRGGFAYGIDATGTQPAIVDPAEQPAPCLYPFPNTQTPWTGQSVTPKLFTISKSAFLHEGETATGPNNPCFYGLIVNVAEGQTIKNLMIRDLLPNNLKFDHIDKVVPVPVGVPAPVYFTGGVLAGFTPSLLNGGVCGNAVIDYQITHGPVFSAGQNYLDVTLCHDLVGIAGAEIALVVACYVPETDVNGAFVLNPADCIARTSQNDAVVEGDWVPLDCRDQVPVNSGNSTHVVSNPAHTEIVDRCVAIQKSRVPPPPATFLPGDIVTYTIDFQLSDYRTFDNIELTDFLSDGQDYVAGSATFWVRDRYGSTPLNVLTPAPFTDGVNLLQQANQTPICRDVTAFANQSATKLTFKVSSLMAALNLNPSHGAGRWTGGYVPTPTTVRGEGQIVFRARVRDAFNHLQGPRPGDLFVDNTDNLDNCASLSGHILDNTTLIWNQGVAMDNSQTSISITPLEFGKSLYAIKPFGGSLILNPPAGTVVGPGDEVTFSLNIVLPSSDAEHLSIRDWLSTPVFSVQSPQWPPTGTLPAWSGAVPPVGQASAGDALVDFFNPWYSGLFPAVIVNAYCPNNGQPGLDELEFLYSNFNDPNNVSRVGQILYTLMVTDTLIGDGYNLVNLAQLCEDNTFSVGTNICGESKAQLILAEPKLKLTKGIVATSDSGAQYFPSHDLGNLVFQSFGTDCQTPKRFASGLLNSTTFPNGLNADIPVLAPNARVTFVIVVENVGHSLRGAFDVKILDTLPPCFINPGPVCVYNGASTALPYTGNLFAGGLVLTDPGTGAIGAYDPVSGLNIALIIFDATYMPTSGGLGCCVNHAELVRYSNVPGGPNFITNPLDASLVANAADDAYAGQAVSTVICAPNKTVNCSTSTGWQFDPPVAAPSCCPDTVITVLNTQSLFPCEITRTWQVNQCGVISVCSQTVTLIGDVSPPVITGVPATTTVPCNAIPAGPATLPAHDDCDVTVTEAVLNPDQIQAGNCPNSYTITRTWTATDACGHMQTATQVIHVEDNTPPTITGCSDITVDCTSAAGASVLYTLPTAVDLCAGPRPVSCLPLPGPFPIGKTTVTCYANDACSNQSSCSFCVTVLAHGQGAWNWVEHAGINYEPVAGNSVAVDKNGNVYVVGTGFGPVTFAGSGVTLNSGFIFLVKYNAVGIFQWARAAGGPTLFDQGNGVTVDDVANVYITGGFQGTATFDNNAAHDLTSVGGSRDIFVAKYDSAGNVLWTQREGGPGDDYGAGIAWTPVYSGGPYGSLFVTGTWGSQPTLQAFLLRLTDLYVTPTISAPILSLPNPASATQFARARSVAVDPLGNPYITGNYGGATPTTFPGSPTGTLPATPPGQPRTFVARFDGNNPGLCTWQTHAGYASATGYSDGMGIAVDPLGANCFVTGYFIGGIDFGGSGSQVNTKNSPAGQLNDYYLTKLLTTDGTAVWAVKGGLNPDSDDETRAVVVDAAGDPYVTGFLHPFPANTGTPFVNEGPTVLLAAYDRLTHALRWTRNANDTIGIVNSPMDVGYGLATDKFGCVHVTGTFTETLEFPPLAPVPAIGVDMFVGKICPTCCDPNPTLNATVSVTSTGVDLILSWDGSCCHLECTGELSGTPVWTFVSNTSPYIYHTQMGNRFFRLVCP